MVKRSKKALIIAIALWFCVAYLSVRPEPAAAQQAAGTLVLRGGQLIDGTGAALIANPIIVISGGKIQSVGTEGSVPVPANATVINTTGKTIMPGLVDSHVHYRNLLAPYFLYWGVTTVGDMSNATGWMLAQRAAIEAGREVGPYIMTVGAKLNAPHKPGMNTGPGDVIAGFQTFLGGVRQQNYITDRASIEAVVLEAKKQKLDAIKLYYRVDPALMKLAAEVAHQHGFRVFAHYTTSSPRTGLILGTDEIIDTGIDVHVHTFGIDKATASKEIQGRMMKGEVEHPESHMDPSKFPVLSQQMVDRRMYLNPTLGAHWAGVSKFREAFDRLNTDFMNGPMGSIMPPDRRTRYLAAFKPASGEDHEEMEEGYRKSGLFVKEFVDRGGKIIAGSDVGPGFVIPGVSMHVEMQILREIGLTPMQIIQASTSWATEAWGKSSEVGTIQPGKRADILVLNRNPLEDITATTDIQQIIQGGKMVDRQALAKWKDWLPRAVPNEVLNHIPFITGISPEILSPTLKTPAEVMITGEGFSPQSRVLINDQLLQAKFYDARRLGVSINPGSLGQGTLPVVVVQPGSGGGTSNMFYIVVAPN